MTPLVTTISALAVAAAFADGVTSENIVGVQDFNGSGSFNLTANTMLPVGDGAAFTLADIKVNDAFDYGSDYLTVFVGGTIQYMATYLGTADAKDEGVDEGWYLTSDFDDWEFTHCKNAEQFAPGRGFVFNRGNAGAALILPNPLAQANN